MLHIQALICGNYRGSDLIPNCNTLMLSYMYCFHGDSLDMGASCNGVSLFIQYSYLPI